MTEFYIGPMSSDAIVTIRPDGRIEVNPKYTLGDAAKAFWASVEANRPVQASEARGDQIGWLNVSSRRFFTLAELAATPRNQLLIDAGRIIRVYSEISPDTWANCRSAHTQAGPVAAPVADAATAEPAAPDLPGMWDASDFTGGDPDERSHSERAATQMPVAWQYRLTGLMYWCDCSQHWADEVRTSGKAHGKPAESRELFAAPVSPTQPAATQQPVAYVGDMRTSAGMEYYVCVEVSGRRLTPQRYIERWKAEFDVAEWQALFTGSPRPDILAYGPENESTEVAAPVSPSREVEALADLWERSSRLVLGSDEASIATKETLGMCAAHLRVALAPGSV